MLAENIAHGSLQRTSDPRPDGPLVAERGDGGAAVHQASGEEPRHGSGKNPGRHVAAHGDELGERRGASAKRVREHGDGREAENASISVEVPKATCAGPRVDPPRSGRLADVAALLGLY